MVLKSRVLIVASAIVLLHPFKGIAADSTEQNQITEVLTTQAQAWNKGNLDQFMQAYIHSDKVSFVSGGSKLVGYEALHERYVKRYGDKPETMGKLAFSNLDIQLLGEKSALCVGNWQVDRKEQTPLTGIFSLVLIKEEGKWKILHDHTSLAESKPSAKN